MTLVSRSTALVGLATSIASTIAPRKVAAQTEPLRVAGIFADLFAEPFYASGSEAFSKAGFTIEPTPLNNAGAIAAAIGGGSLEMGTGDLVSGVKAMQAGVPIVLVAGGGLYIKGVDANAVAMAVAKDSPIRSARELAGKAIGVPTLVGLTSACVKSWLASQGVDPASVKFLEMPQPSAIAAVQRGIVDVALVSEPFVTFAKGEYRSLGSPYDVAADLSPAKQVCISVWYASKSWFEADAARARRAVQAVYDTARWANSHRAATFAILVNAGKLDPSKAQGMQRTTYATSLTPSNVQPALDIAWQNKIFPHSIDAGSIITKV